MLSNGEIYFENDYWWIKDVPPHIAIKLKAIFTHIPKTRVAPFRFPNTPETSNDLVWFSSRFEMKIDAKLKDKLVRQKRKYDKQQDEFARLLNPDYVPTAHSFRDGLSERPYQAIGRELWLKGKRMVCGDDLGLGKTTIALGGFLHPETLPALVVVQTHLPTQWEHRINEFTDLTVHKIEGTKPYSLPVADIYIMKYSCIAGWVDFLATGFFKSVTFDEIQELRNNTSQKYHAAAVASEAAQYVLGLTATLIYNYGNEAFNIFDVVKKGCLGDWNDFEREWCKFGRVIKDPAALGSYLRSHFLFLRRTRSEVSRELPPINQIIHEVEVDNSEVKKIEDLALQLSMRVLGGSFTERGKASRDLDILVRRNTGLAKAREVANYAKIFLAAGEPIILVGWHRDVYDIWLEELKEYNPVMFTGSESATQKEKSKEKFLSGETNLLIMSLRSGPGTDGLQARCHTMLIGELDWSPGVHNQLKGRIDRDGQTEPVMVVFIVCNEGSDPLMIDVLGLKSSQAAFINDPAFQSTQQHSDDARIKQLAKLYLEKHGVTIEERTDGSIVSSPPPGDNAPAGAYNEAPELVE